MPAMTPPKFDGLNTVNSSSDTIGVRTGGGAPVASNLINGDYFIHSHTGGGDSDQLIGHLENAIQQVDEVGAGIHANVTVTVANDTGLVTITNTDGAATLRVDWTDTDLRDLLGFTGGNTGVIAANGGTATGANPHSNGWYPNVPPADLQGDLALAGVRTSPTTVTLAPSGRVVTTRSGAVHTEQEFQFRWLDAERCVSINSPTVTSWDDWWGALGTIGIRWRYYPERDDRDGPAGAGPFTYVCRQDTAAGGSSALKRSVADLPDYYDLTVGAHLYVA